LRLGELADEPEEVFTAEYALFRMIRVGLVLIVDYWQGTA
jgi:hypothetical protein